MPVGIVTGIVGTSASTLGKQGKHVYQLGAFRDMALWFKAGYSAEAWVDHDPSRRVGMVLRLRALKSYSKRLPVDLRDGSVALWAGLMLDFEVEEARAIWRDIANWQFSLGRNRSLNDSISLSRRKVKATNWYEHGDATHFKGVGPLTEISFTRKPANEQTRVLTWG